MRAILLVCILAWSCLAQAQPESEKLRIAKTIVTMTDSQNTNTYSLNAVAARNNYLAEMGKLNNLIKLDSQKNYPKLSSQEVSDIVDKYFAPDPANLDKFVDSISRTIEREIDAYVQNFSVQELEEILAKKPEMINDKHQKFVQETLPMNRSVLLLEARSFGEKIGQGMVSMQRALTTASSEKN
jgi:uncharacterized protein YllA (UPF0747 family)